MVTKNPTTLHYGRLQTISHLLGFTREETVCISLSNHTEAVRDAIGTLFRGEKKFYKSSDIHLLYFFTVLKSQFEILY